MKKILLIIGILILLLVGALAVAPFLFQDKIKALVQEQLDNSLNAKVYFGDIGLSFFRNFPQAHVSIDNLGVVGLDVFDRDTLFQTQSLGLVIDVMSLFGEEIQLNEAIVDRAKIKVLVLEDGRANWDIVKEDSLADDTTGSTTAFKARLNSYEIINSDLYYDDASIPTTVSLNDFSHNGSGDFTATNYDLRTQTSSSSLTVIYDGLTYLKDASVDASVDMNIDNRDEMVIQLLDNLIRVNALELGVEGLVTLRDEDYDIDLSYQSQQNTFSSLLSMVPGVYTADFKDIKTEGTLNFDGFVKGIYNEQQLPGFGINLKVDNAMFQYPDLPQAVTGIQANMRIENPDGDLEKTLVDIQSFHADLGNNPIDAQATIRGIERMDLKGKLKAKLNLEELTSMFPIEDTQLKGLFSIDATADGVYDEALKTFPKVNANMSLVDGYAKNAEYPAELTAINFRATLTDPDGSMEKAVFDMPDFSFKLDGEPIAGIAHVENFDDPTYQLQANGSLDLEKLVKIYPFDSMELSGKLVIDQLNTSGRMSDIEAERYDQLPTSGKVRVQNLRYSDPELAQPVVVQTATATFTPERINISEARGTLGSSDFSSNGYFSNYMAYALMENEPLSGQMTLNSRKMDLNEWMTEAESGEATPEEPLEAIPIPENLDLTFAAKIDELVYDDISLKNVKGNIIVAEEQAAMQDVTFGLLGGNVAMNGVYNTQDKKRPAYNFYIDLQQLAIKEAYKYFNAVQAFMPITRFIDGVCNSTLGIKGALRQDMSPVLESISSKGVFVIPNGSIANFPLLNNIAAKTKLNNLAEPISLDKIHSAFAIQDGFITVEPIELKHKDMAMTFYGRHKLNGVMDYKLDLDMPAGKVGNAAMNALSGLAGGAIKTSDRVQMTLNIGGLVSQPSITGASSATADQLKQDALSTAADKLQEKTGVDLKLGEGDGDVVDQVKEQAKDSITAVVEEVKQQAKDTVTAVVESVKDSVKTRVEDEIKDRVGEDAKETLEDLKDKFGLPKFGKKKK